MTRITKRQWRVYGGLTNPKLTRTQHAHGWAYWWIG